MAGGGDTWEMLLLEEWEKNGSCVLTQVGCVDAGLKSLPELDGEKGSGGAGGGDGTAVV